MSKLASIRVLLAKSMLAITTLTASLSYGHAQVIEQCDWVSSARNIIEPWEQNTRLFANGNVRVSALDTVEPAAGAFHLLVLSPPYDEVGSRQCNIVSMATGIGFSGLNFESLKASYDPKVGLTFTIGVQVYLSDAASFANRVAQFTLNQATGEIQVKLN